LISQEELKKHLNYNPTTGCFIWLTGVRKGKIAGTLSVGYVRISLNCKSYPAHRLAWLYVFGEIPKDMLDHINMVKSDNRICNLREVSNAENQLNKNKVRSLTGYVGVRLNNSGSYTATYSDKQKKIHIGCFKTADEAHIARVKVLSSIDRYRNYDPVIMQHVSV
jgi:hypothetical protein